MIHEIRSAGELEGAIDQLEKSKERQQEQLADSFRDKMESLKPRNIIKSSVTELSSTPFKKKMLIVAATTLTVILLKKVLTSRGSGSLRTIIVGAAISGIVKEIFRHKSKQPV